MWGRSQLAQLAALFLAAGSRSSIVTNGAAVTRATGLSRAFSAPYGAGAFSFPNRLGGYPRKDCMRTAAQHKRASIKARGVAKHRRHA